MACAVTSYDWKQKRHDSRAYEQLPGQFLFGVKKAPQLDLIMGFSRNLNNRLTLLIYQAPIEVVNEIFRRLSCLFNSAGFPIYTQTVNVK